MSEWNSVISGIRQGSVLGSILFVILINDMPNDAKFIMCKVFSVDSKLYGIVDVLNT